MKKIKKIVSMLLLISLFWGPTLKATTEKITLQENWKYAHFSKIKEGSSVLYKASTNRKNITIALNAGHGTKGGSSVKTQTHPDGTPKVTGGSTEKGAVTSTAVSVGTTFLDGVGEAVITLKTAKILKQYLLSDGYDVLMIRDDADVQLDNIARTVIANNNADIHIALHWDSTTTDKGAFYISVPNVESYRNMEPVKSNYQKHHKLGDALIEGLKSTNTKILKAKSIPLDLTQTSYSTIPSIDIELGDRASKHDEETLDKLAQGLKEGVDIYFKDTIKNEPTPDTPKKETPTTEEEPQIEEKNDTSFKNLEYFLPGSVLIIFLLDYILSKCSKKKTKKQNANKKLIVGIFFSLSLYFVLAIIKTFI